MSLQIPRSEAIEIIACGLFNFIQKDHGIEVRHPGKTWLDTPNDAKDFYHAYPVNAHRG